MQERPIASTKPKVALFNTRWLDYSQTFVYEEVRAHQRYDIEVFCAYTHNLDRFHVDTIHTAGRHYEVTRFAPKFDKLLGSGRYSLIHAHFGTGAIYAVPFAKRHNLPLVVTWHGREVPLIGSAARLLPKNWAYAMLNRSVLSQMTLGLCDSAELYEMLLEFGVPKEKLVVHRIGIDVDKFHRGSRNADRPEVTMVGRFVEKKGFESGIRAFARAVRKHPAHMTIIGDGVRREKMKALAVEEGVADLITFAGIKSTAEIAAHLAKTDILMAPSCVACDGDRESGIVTVKEGSAAGAVPLATWHGGIPSIIDEGVTGFMVPERNSEILADRLSLLLGDPAMRERMGLAAQQKMRNEYDNRKVVARLAGHYDRVLGLNTEAGSNPEAASVQNDMSMPSAGSSRVNA